MPGSRELERLELPQEARLEARRLLAEATAASRDGGNPRQVASRLQKLTRVLAQAGGVAKAGVGAIEALTRAATALGPAGKAVAVLLAAVA